MVRYRRFSSGGSRLRRLRQGVRKEYSEEGELISETIVKDDVEGEQSKP